MVDEREVADLVADRPDLEEGLSAILAVDEDHDTWTFDDVPVGTGVFGEIVGHDVVESVDDEYRLGDRAAVEAALEGEVTTAEPAAESARSLRPSVDSLSVGTAGRPVLAGVAVAVLFVAARSVAYAKVFRDGAVVLAGNDPYAYRYWIDRMLAASANPLDLGMLVDLSVGGNQVGEPLFVATMWWTAALLGGTREVAGLVLAVYPVVAALLIGGLVYVLGAHVFGDRRVGLLAAGVLAVLPAHAMRTSLGFADHHAFDYAWLLATVTAMAWVVATDDPLGAAAKRGAVAFGVAVAGLTLSWEGSPLLLIPVAVYLAAVVLLDVDDGRSPLRANAPVVAGLGVAAALTLGAYAVLRWGSTSFVLVPAVLAAGGLAVTGGGDLLARRGVSVRWIAAVELAVPVVGLTVLSVAAGDLLSELATGFLFVFGTSGIGEAASAFAPRQFVGVKLFGGVVVLSLPMLAWAGRRAVLGDRRWLVLSVFTWYFLALSLLQLRFVGQLAPLVSVFAALGILWGLARLDLAPLPVPVRESVDAAAPVGPREDDQWLDLSGTGVRSGVAALLLVGAVLGPGLVFLPDQVQGSAVSDRNYETAQWMADYADERGWTYPRNYVFSQWGQNRMFNYAVNGQAGGYAYALEAYAAFISAEHADPWYDRLRDKVGFVVLEPIPVRDNTVQQHLHRAYGSRWVTPDGQVRYEAVTHFRAVYASSDGGNKVFVTVPGARVTGTAAPNATVELETTVEIPNDRFTYRQVVAANDTGHYRAVVPYPGTYELTVDNRTTTATVPEPAVENGSRVRVGE